MCRSLAALAASCCLPLKGRRQRGEGPWQRVQRAAQQQHMAAAWRTRQRLWWLRRHA